MQKGWNSNIAEIWTKMVGPSRPTISELNIYTKYAHELQQKLKRRLDILILGSTPEFRDWAFEENMNVTVMDANIDYNNKISRELRHKCIIDKTQGKERLVIKRWEDIDFEDEFDIIIGDLAIGNIQADKLEKFIAGVHKSLRVEGLFLGKSFFKPRDYEIINPEELIKEYYSEKSYYHPYSSLVFDLTMYCIDENNMLDFKVLYNELIKLKNKELIKDETMKYFEGLGWDTEMKFKFHVPKIEDYEKLLKKYMNIKKVEYGLDVYSNNFPLYIVEN